MVDFSEIKKNLGLSGAEFAALLGVPRDSGIVYPRKSKIPTARSLNHIVRWFMSTQSKWFVPRLLDYWIIAKPRNRDDARRLIRIARRFKPSVTQFNKWEKAIRRAHPEFFRSTRVQKPKKHCPETV